MDLSNFIVVVLFMGFCLLIKYYQNEVHVGTDIMPGSDMDPNTLVILSHGLTPCKLWQCIMFW